MLKPIILILTALSVLWDFRVFTQIYVLQKAGGISRETNLLGVWAYQISIGQNQFGVGAAIAIVMVLITLVLTIFYLRSMTRTEEIVSGVVLSVGPQSRRSSRAGGTSSASSSSSSSSSRCTGWC